MLHYQVQRVGRNRGVPRVWLQGLVLVRAGFHAGASFATHIAAMRLELVLDGQGERTVSAKARGDARLPIVDLNSAKLLAELADLAAVRIVVPRPGRIVIEALASDLRRRARLDRAWARLAQADSLFIGSVSHGGGMMSHALHRGFAQDGIDCVVYWSRSRAASSSTWRLWRGPPGNTCALPTSPPDSSRWSPMTGLKTKHAHDEAEGKGFRLQIFDHDASSIGTVTKGYAKVRSTDPKICHQDKPDLLRQLTPAEHARAKSIPSQLADGLSETIAHEMLGQSVHVGDSLLAPA